MREYYPAAWTNGLCRAEARELLKLAPRQSRVTDPRQITAALKRSGRKRDIEADIGRLREALRGDWARQPPLVEDAFGKQMLALLIQLDAGLRRADRVTRSQGPLPPTA
ncbi:hypothetical protein [Streptomyces canus]|uniref:hypothetical protein n=1 Tax=Streptomyces canus TaxID=58343 RepID=UPI002E26CA9D